MGGTSTVVELVQKSRRLRARGAFGGALELARQACERDRHDPDAWKERALAAEAVGHIHEAAAALFCVGDLLAQATDHARAHEMMERVLLLVPDHEGAQRMRAWLAGKIAPRGPGDVVIPMSLLARGTLPPIRCEAAPDFEDTLVDWEPPELTPNTHNFTRATAIANAALASPLLLSLRSDALVALSRHAAVLDETGACRVYSEGDEAGAMYFVVEGDVTLSRSDALPVRCGAGDLFGAEALLYDGERAFTAHKPVRAEVLQVALEDVRALIDEDAQARAAFAEAARVEIATAFVHRHGFAAQLGPEAAADFVARATLREVRAGEIVVDHGMRPDGLLYIASGRARLTGSNRYFEPGDAAGAQWVLAGQVATHSIRAVMPGWLLVIERAAAAELLAAHPLLLARLSQ